MPSSKYMKKKSPYKINQESNFRDLGGIKTKEGRKIKPDHIFRSGHLGNLTEEELNHINNLGIGLLIDFRSDEERIKSPDKLANRIKTIHIPIYDDSFGEKQISNWLMEGNSHSLNNMLINANSLFVTDFQSEFSLFLKKLEKGEKTIFHCNAGKDRAGFATALFLSALGVERETIFKDYLESNIYLHNFIEKTVAFVNTKDLKGELLIPVLGVRKEYLEAAFKLIDNKYHGIENYLKLLNIDSKKLRQLYLE